MPISAPTDIANCVGWYDASQIDASNRIYDDVDELYKITRWPELSSGVMADLVPHGDDYRPIYIADHHNGMPTVYFRGSGFGCIMRTESQNVLATPNTAFLVAQKGPGADTTYYLLDARSFGTQSNVVRTAFSNVGFWQYNWSSVQYGSALLNTRPQVIAVQFNGSSSFMNQDTAETTGGEIDNPDWDALTLGAQYTNGNRAEAYVSELIVYNAALTSAQIDQVNQYLMNKWGVFDATIAATSGLIASNYAPPYATIAGISDLDARGYARPLQGIVAATSGIVPYGYASPISSTHEATAGLEIVGNNYHPAQIDQHYITMESYLTPQIEVPVSVPAGVTPRVFKRKHWDFP